jgi:hypothetical protein
MKKFMYLLFISLLAISCESENNDCACYETALSGGTLSEECKSVVEGLTEDQLKEKSNECFAGAIEELTGM